MGQFGKDIEQVWRENRSCLPIKSQYDFQSSSLPIQRQSVSRTLNYFLKTSIAVTMELIWIRLTFSIFTSINWAILSSSWVSRWKWHNYPFVTCCCTNNHISKKQALKEVLFSWENAFKFVNVCTFEHPLPFLGFVDRWFIPVNKKG